MSWLGDVDRRSPSLASHRATTAHLAAAFPFMASSELTGRGVLIGTDLGGSPFAYDPFHLYEQGILTNPNMIVIGQIGRGKSAFVKSYLWRQAVFGRRAWVLDPKGEYGSLARAWGAAPIALRPGGDVRLNPLELAGRGDPDGARRQAELLATLCSACLGRPLFPAERAAADVALVDAVMGCRSQATLPAVVEALLDPSEQAASSLRMSKSQLAREGRDLALELRRLVLGDLRGMFDGPTTPSVRLDGPIAVLDLSALYGSDALGIVITCAAAWLQTTLWNSTATAHTIVVVDEAWAVLADVAVARWLQASWKLARALGVANIAVLHRCSDLTAAGEAGSSQWALAGGLLSDSETRVLYGQAPGEVGAAAQAIGLSRTEAQVVSHLGRGTALWKVGNRSFLVRHRISDLERELVDTDVAMQAGLGGENL